MVDIKKYLKGRLEKAQKKIKEELDMMPQIIKSIKKETQTEKDINVLNSRRAIHDLTESVIAIEAYLQMYDNMREVLLQMRKQDEE